MPAIPTSTVGLAVDLTGCPNLCRHCYLGFRSARTLSEDDLREASACFRSGLGEIGRAVGEFKVASWFREPDNSADYRGRYAIEDELSDGPPVRYELLSIKRISEDPNYARWAAEVGPDTCQVTFFGLEETNDWFYQRPGAFQEYLLATERLLEVGIKPRWQFILTKKLLSDIDGLFGLVDKLKLRERVAELGGVFDCFTHPPDPDGAARGIEDLRPTDDDIAAIPHELMEMTRAHFGRASDWKTEADLIDETVTRDEGPPVAYGVPPVLWFQVKSNWDVYSNVATLEPWWRIGNLRKDSVAEIFARYEQNAALGFELNFAGSQKRLAQAYGDPSSRKIYSAHSDLMSRYLAEHCAGLWKTYRRDPYPDAPWGDVFTSA